MADRLAGMRAWCDNPKCIHRGHEVLDGTTAAVVVDRDDLRAALAAADHGGAYFSADHSFMERLYTALGEDK